MHGTYGTAKVRSRRTMSGAQAYAQRRHRKAADSRHKARSGR